MGHQLEHACYSGEKDEAERVHLQKNGGVPDICTLVLRTVDEIRDHHVTNVANDRMDGTDRLVTKIGKLHKSIVSSPVFPISSLDNMV